MAQDNSQQEDLEASSQASTGQKETGKGSPRKRVILIAIVVVVLVGIGLYMFLTRNHVSTDDAYTTGRKISIAPHVSGFVEKMLVDDNQLVHKGDLLVQLDGRDYLATLHRAEAAVQQAQADMNAYEMSLIVAKKNFPGRLVEAQGNVAAAEARLFKARTDYSRQHRVARAATTQQDIDYAKAALDEATAAVVQAQGQLTQAEPVQANIDTADAHVTQAVANLTAARADLEKARLDVEWTMIRAPRNGRISQRNIEQGNFVQTGQEMFSIVPDDIWIVANYKETQLKNMRPGQKVDIEIDAYPQLHLKGHVDSFQMGSGESFSAFPPENATGNFVKTVQRIPVKILIDSGLDPKIPLAIGLSVEPTVYTE
ncbi:HlyD family secretion protein [Acetobacteraceae bacterium ESL0709]|nr:HlyD family secretion protein [Acetobacteraceae bacterium ESL0697]MDF7678769.1 HlyD family secretion protein [Acetobacteraceae bacterium ESL0709]